VYTTSEKGYNNYLFNFFGKTKKKVLRPMRKCPCYVICFPHEQTIQQNRTGDERKGNELQAQGATPQSFEKICRYKAGHSFAY
jgi:hypothetical protein